MNPFNRFWARARQKTAAPEAAPSACPEAKAEVIGALTNLPTEDFLARRVELGHASHAAGLTVEDDGYLSALEIYDWTDPGGISPLPPLARLELSVER